MCLVAGCHGMGGPPDQFKVFTCGGSSATGIVAGALSSRVLVSLNAPGLSWIVHKRILCRETRLTEDMEVWASVLGFLRKAHLERKQNENDRMRLLVTFASLISSLLSVVI